VLLIAEVRDTRHSVYL